VGPETTASIVLPRACARAHLRTFRRDGGARRFATASTVDPASDIGRSSVTNDGVDRELEVVAAADGPTPARRTATAIGGAKAGETLGMGQTRAPSAKGSSPLVENSGTFTLPPRGVRGNR